MSSATHCRDLSDLAVYLGYASQNLYYLVSNRDRLYVRANLTKQTRPEAEIREVDIPCSELKGVQKTILRHILNDFPVSNESYAYVQGRSVVTLTKKLCNQQSILKLDIQDFFSSITANRVMGLFVSLGFNTRVAFILTQLTTYQGRLTQGSPTSPYISNLISTHMDKDLKRLANSWGLNYARYSDDMFFFSRQYFRYRAFERYARSVISDHGFQLNRSKTKFYPADKPRIILGVSTHGSKPALPKRTRRAYKAAFFQAARNLNWGRKHHHRLRGMAEWYKAIYGEDETYKEYMRVLSNVRAIMLHDKYRV